MEFSEAMQNNPEVKFNNNVKLIVSDVDETVADLYKAADPAMIQELILLLEEDRSIFFVTGQGIKSVQWRITDQIPRHLRKKILVGHCSGAEVVGFDEEGNLKKPYYSVYDDSLNEDQKKEWRNIIDRTIEEFELRKHEPPMAIKDFEQQIGHDPKDIMYEDRGPQITFEVVNGHKLTDEQIAKIPQAQGKNDLREAIVERANQLLLEAKLPVDARKAAVFAVDFVVKDVNKTYAVKYALDNENVLTTLDLSKEDLKDSNNIEVWGDKFSYLRGGTDRYMSEALPEKVRSIDFRREDPSEFLPGYHTVVWQGQKELHEGLLEYLQSRHKS